MQFLVRMTVFGVRLAPILLVAYWIMLFTGTHLPRVPMPAIRNLDKVQHFVAFSGLAFLLAWSIPTRAGGVWKKAGIAFLIAVVYGIIDELTQPFFGRNRELADFFADCLGALFGVWSYLLLRRFLYRKISCPPLRDKKPETSAGPVLDYEAAINNVGELPGKPTMQRLSS